jgi:tetratricopeptide (TPR) repeat protein
MVRRQAIAASPNLVVKRRHWKWMVLAGLLVAGTLTVYLQAARFGYMTVDDAAYASENVHVQQGITWRGVVWSFTSIHDSNWIPFTWLSLMLDSDLYGVRPSGYHFTNILLHTANGVLLFAALAYATGNALRSAFVAALFAIHPLHVESVAWIAERKDVLSTFFGLLSLLMYLRYAERGGRWSLAVSLLFLVASLLSKQTLVTLPFVFLLLDFWPLGRLRIGNDPLRRAARLQSAGEEIPIEKENEAPAARQSSLLGLLFEKIPFFILVFAFSAMAAFAQSWGGAVRAFQTLPLYARAMNAVSVYVLYLWKAFYPHNLAIYYPYPGAELTPTVVALSAAFLMAVTAGAIVCVRRLPFLLVGWLWYLGTLLPMIGLVQIGSQQMADRYTYFPLIGIFLAVGWLVAELVPAGFARSRLLPAAALALLVVLGVTAFRQVGLWADNVVLLRHSKDCTRDHLLAHQFLGSALYAEGSLNEGIDELQMAVREGPWSAPAHLALALALQKAGRFDEAIPEYRAALAIDDHLAAAHNNLGFLLLKRRKFAEAKQQYQRAIEVDETFVDAHVNLAFLCLTTRDYPEAITQARRALELKPESPTACRVCIALALRGEGLFDEAIGTLEQVVKAAPNDQVARQELARTVAMKRRAAGR